MESKTSKSYDTALNRAMARGDSDRVVQLYAVPVDKRAAWKPSDTPTKAKHG